MSPYLSFLVDKIKFMLFNKKEKKVNNMNNSSTPTHRNQDTDQQKMENNKLYIAPTAFLQNAMKNQVPNISAEMELLGMIPGWSNPEANALSKIYHTFKGLAAERKTDIPVGIPIFSYLAFLSSQLVKNEITYIRPSEEDGTSDALPFEKRTKEELNAWFLILADSGDAKSFSIDVMKKATQLDSDFDEVQSALALAQNISDNPKGLWINDEFGQLWQTMQGTQSEGGEWKKVFLKARDGSVEWKSKATQIEKRKDIALTTLLINTEHQFNKATSDDSLKDGMARRLSIAYVVENDLKQQFDRITLNKDSLINAIKPNVEESLKRVENLKGSTFTFDSKCWEQANNVYKLCGALYVKTGFLEKAFVKTYLNESYKFAIYMHVITKQEGTVISPESMEKGLAVALVLLDSFKKFLIRRSEFPRKSTNLNNRHLLEPAKQRISTKTHSVVSATAKRIEKLRQKEEKKGGELTRRDIQRTYRALESSEIDLLFELYKASKNPPNLDDAQIPF